MSLDLISVLPTEVSLNGDAVGYADVSEREGWKSDSQPETLFIIIRRSDRFVFGGGGEMCVWTSLETAKVFANENGLGPEWEGFERPVAEIKEQARKLGFNALLFDAHSMTATHDKSYMRKSL